MILCDIVFQSGDFYNQDGSNFWETFGAVAIPLIVFGLGYIAEKWREHERRKEHVKNTLKYLASSIESVISYAEKQANCCKEFYEALQQNPYVAHPITNINSENLNRIVRKAEHEKMFHAYVNYFSNRQERISKFKSIYSLLDYVFVLNGNILTSYGRYQNEYNLDKYIEISDELLLHLTTSIIRIKRENPDYRQSEFFNTLEKNYQLFIKKRPTPLTINYTQENLVKPLLKGIIEKHINSDEGLIIADYCRRATQEYNKIIRITTNTSDMFKLYQDKLTSAVTELKKSSNDLAVIYSKDYDNHAQTPPILQNQEKNSK